MRPARFAQSWRHIVLIAGSLLVVLPFLWMFTTSLQSRAETYTNTSLLPTSWHWENYDKAWDAAPFGQYTKPIANAISAAAKPR